MREGEGGATSAVLTVGLTYLVSKSHNKRIREERNRRYVAQLIENPTRAELYVRLYLDQIGVQYVFQHGMLVPFHRIFDFYFPALKIALEVDGSSHHGREKKDRRKDEQFLKYHGIKTYRITNEAVFGGRHRQLIGRILAHAPFQEKPKAKPQRDRKEQMANRARREQEAKRNRRKRVVRGWGML